MKRLKMASMIFATCMGSCSPIPSMAGPPIQQLPPTPLGSTTDCPSGMQQVLSYSGTPAGGPQGGINCVPIVTDAVGDMAAGGYVQMGATTAACDPAHAGALQFVAAAGAFEGCDGANWRLFGGIVPTYTRVSNDYWAYCPQGQHAIAGGAACDVALSGYATTLRYSMPVFIPGQAEEQTSNPQAAIGWFAGCGYWQGSWTAASSIWVACE